MKIRSLKLTNFRGAVDLPLTLNERLKLSVGLKGPGKPTLPDAVARAPPGRQTEFATLALRGDRLMKTISQMANRPLPLR